MLKFTTLRHADGNIKALEVSINKHQLLNSAKLNKGSAFTAEEREAFELKAILPDHIESLEDQAQRHYQQYLEIENNLAKNIYLTSLHDNNETLFYYLVGQHLKEMLPIIYTPTVGEAVEKFSHELRRPRGLFIAYPDKERIPELLDHRLNPDVDLILVTDGGRVLGLGDQGIGGMNIAIGKLMVYTACSGVNPHRVLPIQLDLGTNNEALLNDPMYLGWRHKRIEGKEYDDFIDAFVKAVQNKFPNIYLHWEDFARENARCNLERYRNKMCTFNDDMQGTGAVALSAVLSGIQAAGGDIKQQQIVILGAGTAGCGIADQIYDALIRSGLSEKQARACFWMVDRDGLLTDDMNNLMPFQLPYVHKKNELINWQLKTPGRIMLEDVINNIHATVLIGCSAVPGAFTENIIRTMAKHTEYPVILPLSNPTSKAEAHPADLLEWTNGKALIATGSPFDDVIFEGKKIRISQSNNSFIFPGLGLGVIAAKSKYVTDNMIWAACETLTSFSPAKQDSSAPLLPDLDAIHVISEAIAKAVVDASIKERLTNVAPEDINYAIRAVKWEAKYYPYLKKP